MMPTAVIIAMAVESAPTRTEVRRKDAEKLAEKFRGKRSQSVYESGHRQRRCCYEQNRGEIAQQWLTCDRGSARRYGCCQAEHKSQPQIPGFLNADVIFPAAPRHRLDGRDQGSLACRRIGGCNRDPNANREREKNRCTIQPDGSWPAADIKRLHRGGHQPNRARCHEPADGKADESASKAKADGFADKRGENNITAGAEGAHDSNLRAAAND